MTWRSVDDAIRTLVAIELDGYPIESLCDPERLRRLWAGLGAPSSTGPTEGAAIRMADALAPVRAARGAALLGAPDWAWGAVVDQVFGRVVIEERVSEVRRVKGLVWEWLKERGEI